MTRDLLKPFGAENDQAYVAILEWFKENRRRVNANELALMPFKRFSKPRREMIPFAAATIDRKARQLGEWGLLMRGYDLQHHTWYAWPENQEAKTQKRPEMRVEIRNGQRVAVFA